MKRLYLFIFAICLLGTSLAGCGPKEQAKGNTEEAAEKKDDKASKGTKKYAELNGFLEAQSGGKVNVLHEKDESFEHTLGNLKVKLESYEVVELKGVVEQFTEYFNGNKDGKLVVAKYTIHNAGKEDLYFKPSFALLNSNIDYYSDNNYEFLPTASQIYTKLNRDSNYVVKGGETVNGYEAYPLTEKAFSKGTAQLIIPEVRTDKKDYTSTVGETGKYYISLNENGTKKLKHNATFYADKTITEDLGIKKMLKEKKGINKKTQRGDAEITLNGYQFTRFKPYKKNRVFFGDYKQGVVLLTAEFTVNNKGKQPIEYLNTYLYMNDKSVNEMNDSYLSDKNKEIVKAGDIKKLLQVYVIDEEQYEKVLKDKDFIVSVDPFPYERKAEDYIHKDVEIVLPK